LFRGHGPVISCPFLLQRVFTAAPTPTPAQPTGTTLPGNRISARDPEDLFVRELLAARDDESGASLFSGLLKGATKVLGSLFDNSSSAPPPAQTSAPSQKRDTEELVRRDLEDLLVRELLAARDDESGASLISGPLKGATKIFGSLFDGGSSSPPPAQTSAPATPPQKRDMEALFVRELLAARDGSDEDSRAFSLSDLLKGLSGLLRRANELEAREFDELFLCELLNTRDDESGATFLQTISGLAGKQTPPVPRHCRR